MDFGIQSIISLLKDKKLDLDKDKSAYAQCGEEINSKLYLKGDSVFLDFSSPYPYIVIDKVGGLNVFDITRKIIGVEIGPTYYTLRIDGFPDITRDRE